MSSYVLEFANVYVPVKVGIPVGNDVLNVTPAPRVRAHVVLTSFRTVMPISTIPDCTFKVDRLSISLLMVRSPPLLFTTRLPIAGYFVPDPEIVCVPDNVNVMFELVASRESFRIRFPPTEKSDVARTESEIVRLLNVVAPAPVRACITPEVPLKITVDEAPVNVPLSWKSPFRLYVLEPPVIIPEELMVKAPLTVALGNVTPVVFETIRFVNTRLLALTVGEVLPANSVVPVELNPLLRSML